MVFGLPPSVKIYFARDLVDMRNGIDGLRAMVEGALKKDLYDGHLFVFVGKSKDKVKILFWDKNGFVLHMKRLEKGRFQLPVVDERKVKVEMVDALQEHRELRGLLNAKRLKRWSPSIEQGIDTDR